MYGNPQQIVPCAQWKEQLAALHPDDLSIHERLALEEHLKECAACRTVFADYQIMRSWHQKAAALSVSSPSPEAFARLRQHMAEHPQPQSKGNPEKARDAFEEEIEFGSPA